MADLFGFNAANVEPSNDFEPIPAGTYVAVIESSEKKATRAGTGHYLELKIQIAEGQYKGRFIWDRLNLWNQNPTAVKIANQSLSAICRAVGIMTPGDSSELHNKPIAIVVKSRRREDNGELSSEVKGYKSVADTPVADSPSAEKSADDTAAPWDK
jgi:hypothetical protein